MISEAPGPAVRIAAAVLPLILAACEENSGSPKPPESFGKVETAAVGCPDIDGTYRWPPKEGVVEGYDKAGKPRRDGYASPEFFGVSFSGPAEFDLRREGKGLAFVVRRPLRQGRMSYNEIVEGAHPSRVPSAPPTSYDCSKGWVLVSERGHPHPKARENYGGEAKLGAKLARLEGGDLVLAQWVRVVHRRANLFTWSDSHAGSVPAPDKVYWHWARFERVK